MIQNPILRGFNPDPSIIRVGEDYYIATSTFEWFPGVQIHHSKDLKNWELVHRPLNRVSQLDMIGNPDSCGVWAPCLSYDNGIFYLIYTNVRSFDGAWKDTPNYLVTTRDILGDWSEPIFLDASGFDPSLFHDDDGRKWYASMIVDHRKGKLFGGIILQEYDAEQQKLIGPVFPIFEGTLLGCTEGPHIYKRNGYYYLLMAEGGTEYGHAISLARSKSITGPYEVHPENPIITARDNPEAPLQKCGHGDIVETADGDWYAVFLVGRPLTQRGRCTLGRETAIEEVEWREDGWLYAKNSSLPRLQIPSPKLKEAAVDNSTNLQKEITYQFKENLSIDFQSLRIPIENSWCSLTDRPGYLRLVGKESLSSFHRQSLIARRIQHFDIEASTCVEFYPTSFQQLAGLVFYYNTAHWIYLHLMGTKDPDRKRLQIIVCDNFRMEELLEVSLELINIQEVYLKGRMNKEALQFYYGTTPNEWLEIGPVIDASILSDDYVCNGSDRYRPAFTGAFVGMCCQDLTGQNLPADFQCFTYKEL